MRTVNITPSDGFVQGSDLTYTVPILNESTDLPQDMTGWTLLWKMWDQDGTAKLNKTATAVNYSATKDGFQWTIADTDTISALGAETIAEGLYRHEGWRVDEGNEVCLFKGDVHLLASDRRQETS